MKKLIIYGASYVDIIKVIDNIKKNEDIAVVGFLDDVKYGREETFMGYPIIGNKDDVPKYKNECYFVNNVFGSPARRKFVFNILNGCDLYSVIDPSVNTNHVSIGDGVYVGEQVFLGALSLIKDWVSIRGLAYIGHEAILGKNVYIAPCACVLGRVSVGDCSWIGGNSVIRNGISIGNNVTVGCGAVVVADVPNNMTVVGNPAKPIQRK